mgnify:CR=1 FL=1
MPDLPKRTLGRTGVEVTMLGFGAMELRGGNRGQIRIGAGRAGNICSKRPAAHPDTRE